MAAHESEESLSALLDGRLTAEETGRAEGHLTGCPSCRAVLAGLGAVRDLLRRAPKRPMPAGLAAEIQRLADARPIGRRRFLLPVGAVWGARRPGVWAPALGLAAAALLVGLWAWTSILASRLRIPLGPLLAAHQRYASGCLLAAASPAPDDFSAAADVSEGGRAN